MEAMEMSNLLFDKGPAERPSPGDVAAWSAGRPRLRVPHRAQVELRWASLDELLEADHPARAVWAAACGLDLGRWLQSVKAVEGHAGRDATDPRLLVALWVYATLEGVGSARELARLCEKHLAYQWLCGGVTANYHLLADFRSQNGLAWDELLTQIAAALLAENLVTMNRVAQDGMRTRASAGKSSFRRATRLQECLVEARRQVEALSRLAEEPSEELSARQRSARQRAAQERAERIERAIGHCQQVQDQRDKTAKKSGRASGEARASTTDPEARVMQFSDGGYRPGYNVQYATDVASGVIVGVDAANVGNDAHALPPMLGQLQRRYGRAPQEALVDGGFASLESISAAALAGATVYAPLKDEQKDLAAGKDPYAPKPADSPAVAAWRARMGAPEAKAVLRLRPQSAEWVNAQARNRGLRQMPVRGLAKCRIVATLYAIAHNLWEAVKLRAASALTTG
jgi:transposase